MNESVKPGGGKLTMAGMVLIRNTTPVTPVASSAIVPLVKPRLWKI
jgi:hypothetical protein